MSNCMLFRNNWSIAIFAMLYVLQVATSQLIDPSREEVDVRLWHDQLFAKPAKHGGVVAWYV